MIVFDFFFTFELDIKLFRWYFKNFVETAQVKSQKK